jgi:hypothetical protein
MNDQFQTVTFGGGGGVCGDGMSDIGNENCDLK